MFRIFKVANCITHSAQRLELLEGWHRLTTVQRFYSKKDCKTPPKSEGSECVPPDQGEFCQRKPVDCNPPGHKPLPVYNDCPSTNAMDSLPKPQCSYKEHEGQQKKSYLKVLIFGAIVLLVSVATVYKGSSHSEPVQQKSKRKIKQVSKIPSKSSEIPNEVPYLLIGGGTASFSAFRAIKSAEPDAKILVISNEDNFPHMRPPLSKELWFSPDESAVRDLKFKQWNGTERSLYYEPDDFYESCKNLMSNPKGGVAVAKGWVVTHLDVVGKKVFLEDGYEISYDKCLIATGSTPKNLDIFENAPPAVKEKVTVFREIHDFQALHHVFHNSNSLVIIGGGFLGSELACALARKGKDNLHVTQIFKEGGNMGKILPEYLSLWTTEKVKKEGVNVMPYAEVTGVKLQDDQVEINLSNGSSVLADHVVVAIGVVPNTTLAEKSELEVDPELGGYLVNTELQARSHLYIAGDCSCFYDTKLGRRRVEHHDHAVVSGRLAGENMAGASKPYWHQSMFWSDLGPEVGYEAIGIVDSTLPTVGVFAKATSKDSPGAVVAATDEGIRSETELVSAECEPHYKADPEQMKLIEKIKKEQGLHHEGEDFGKGVIFYLRDDIVVGILLWNVFNRMNIARQVLKDERKYDDLNEVAKLFNIHEE
ncbi:hypothetical protein PPYR_07249 [Photinus pyralis]|uniref:FAD/NAD(P)-binding domain-containing protein n=2 Tax=Photinus pyralis TaxID=7054 RepID=A0A1Y1LC16_PHOPY|nr:apoptosis-inducing factor 1, mitochondrial [Photinus pyralis]KAB0799369.1 hypothetical protein PPYR_07249 [Photinus pyralis]